MTEFIVIHSNTHMQRHVVYIQEKLFKIQPASLAFPDLQIKQIVKDTQRFCFWEPTDNLELKEKIITFLKEKGEFNLFTSEFRGIRCEKLLYNTSSCYGAHFEEKSDGMTIDKSHIFRFLKYLIESIQILSNSGIEHQDLSLANTIVFPTDQETTNKSLCTSFPIIIDFGYSKITEVPIASQNNLRDLVSMFFACRYGLCKLGTRNPTSWIIHAIPQNQYPEIEHKLDKFNRKRLEENLSFEYLLSLV